MSRISECFTALAAQGRCALIPYFTAGDPEPSITLEVMHAAVAAGADIIELGVPFSDPMADGPAIQAAFERALASGVTLDSVLAMVADFRRHNQSTPLVLMGYTNPIEVKGYAVFAEAAAQAGVDGVIVVDLPPEEAVQPGEVLAQAGIDTIFLLSPTTSNTRMQKICEQARGFVYYVSLKGVTGASSLDTAEVAARVHQVKQATRLPVGVGFGIRDVATAKAVGKVADAVVVGSALVDCIAGQPRDQARAAVSHLISELREGLDSLASANAL